jgi:antitoxin component YwqK of YwqJK toxin-antitoxin module
MRRIDIADPDVDLDYDQRLLYRGELFTGEVEENLAGHRVSLETYTDGHRDGPFHSWYKSGTRRSEGTMRRGFVSGESKSGHENGLLAQKRVHSADGKTPPALYAWDEEGHPTRTWERNATQE